MNLMTRKEVGNPRVGDIVLTPLGGCYVFSVGVDGSFSGVNNGEWMRAQPASDAQTLVGTFCEE